MIDIGYVCITANHCIYMCKTAEGSSIVGIHVDDMCATASNMAEMAKLKEQLRKFFSLVDLGELKWLLGIVLRLNLLTPRHPHTPTLLWSYLCLHPPLRCHRIYPGCHTVTHVMSHLTHRSP